MYICVCRQVTKENYLNSLNIGDVCGKCIIKIKAISMSEVLVIVETNCSDEFDVEGFTFIEIDVYKEAMSKLDSIEYPFELSVGTNEYVFFESKEQVKEALKMSRIISREESETIKNVFGNNFGLGTELIYAILEQEDNSE